MNTIDNIFITEALDTFCFFHKNCLARIKFQKSYWSGKGRHEDSCGDGGCGGDGRRSYPQLSFLCFLTIIIVVVKEELIITVKVLSTWWPFYNSFSLQTFQELPGLCLQLGGNVAITEKVSNLFHVEWVYLESRWVLEKLFLCVVEFLFLLQPVQAQHHRVQGGVVLPLRKQASAKAPFFKLCQVGDRCFLVIFSRYVFHYDFV